MLAVARRLLAAGKDVIELEIGDSPFPTSPAALEAGVEAIGAGHTHYGPSLGLPEFRAAAAEYVARQYALPVTADHVVVGPGRQDLRAALLRGVRQSRRRGARFQPALPDLSGEHPAGGARMVLSRLRAPHDFRPDLADVERFLASDPSPKAIFLNSPHNPTGGVAALEDLEGLAGLIRGRDVAVFSDEPYDAMVWRGRHRTLLGQPGMLETVRRRLHLQQVVQHERLAARVRGRQPRRRSRCWARSPTRRSRACRRSPSAPAWRRWPTTGRCGTSAWPTSAARWSVWSRASTPSTGCRA